MRRIEGELGARRMDRHGKDFAGLRDVEELAAVRGKAPPPFENVNSLLVPCDPLSHASTTTSLIPVSSD